MMIFDNLVSLYYRSATGKIKNRNSLAFLGFVLFTAAVTVYIVISLQFDKIFGFPPLAEMKLSIIISLPVMSLGIAIIVWCIVCFLAAKGTPVPLLPPKELVTRGPYAFSRNPMVTGLIIFMFGLGIYMRSISLTIIFAPLFIFLSYLELKLVEEPELEKRLGDGYLNYRKQVPMFFPSFRRKDFTQL